MIGTVALQHAKDEAVMRQRFNIIMSAFLFICPTGLAYAEDAGRLSPSPTSTFQQGTRTAKERLGPKWTDEQRIDNCNVPPDKRGTKPRPTICVYTPSS